MKKAAKRTIFFSLQVFGFPLAAGEVFGDEVLNLALHNKAYHRSDQYFLYVTGNSSTNYTLIESNDLQEWKPVADRLGIITDEPHFYMSRDFTPNQITFWRAVPAIPVSERMKMWSELGIKNYRFSYFRSAGIYFYSGKVTVLGGEVAEVSEIHVLEGAQPPDPDQFVSIDELFQNIMSWFEAGIDEMNIVYNDEFHFPLWIFLDPGIKGVDDEGIIRVDNFTVLDIAGNPQNEMSETRSSITENIVSITTQSVSETDPRITKLLPDSQSLQNTSALNFSQPISHGNNGMLKFRPPC